MEKDHGILPHLYRNEYSKIVAVLTRLFGFNEIGVAEDIAADTFLIATETWGLKGLPPNPAAWLYNVAKNNARDYLKRKKVFENKIAPELAITGHNETEIDLSPGNISDSQLQMLFTICHPSLSAEAQVCLALRVLCGFGIEEIADAFLSNKETINKRLLRAKDKLRTRRTKVQMPPPQEVPERLANVLTTLYLLFNEGYYSVSQNTVIRKDLCLEAIRLGHLLTESKQTNTPEVNALLALMCLHASRFEARLNHLGDLILYSAQDRQLWNQDLISLGEYYLDQSAQGEGLSRYHLEAGIAYWHIAESDTLLKWQNVLNLYDLLLQTSFSPTAAVHRCFAFSKVYGSKEAITEVEKLSLPANYLYNILMGELHLEISKEKATSYFSNALLQAKTQNDKQAIQQRLSAIPNSQ